MIDSSTRRSSAEQGAPRVYDRPRPAVTEFSRRGSKTTVSQEFATHTGAAAKSLGSILGRGSRVASGRPAAAARTSRRAERPERHNATARVEAAQQAKDAVAAKASAVGGFYASHKLLCIAVGVLVAAALLLYGPTATYYRAWRAGLDLQAQYDALAQSNDRIQQQNDALLTREGIEEEARRRGYVGAGETGVVVEGLPDDSASSSDATPEYPWYVGVGDVIFGYERQ
ncbi:FtsB family cell division protein [Paratractidigestivibacter faecalis]|uniref:Septum formation initiator family protein n=1 Tax=Paratractidigestivibacter faecalis TaxID=2292441 RepID=A0ABV1IEK7_9ACTN